MQLILVVKVGPISAKSSSEKTKSSFEKKTNFKVFVKKSITVKHTLSIFIGLPDMVC